MAQTRRLFFLLFMANLLFLAAISGARSSSVSQGLAALSGFLLLAGIWMLVARRGMFPMGDLACAVALVLTGYGAPAIVDGITLFGIAMIYRGTFGGDAFTRSDRLSGIPFLAAILYLAGYVGGRLFEKESIMHLGSDLLYLVPEAISAVVVGRVLARNALAKDRSLQREAILGEASRALGGATNASDMHQIVLNAALRIVGPIDGARVTMLVPHSDGYSAVVAEGADSVVSGLHAEKLPPSVEAALQEQGAQWLSAEQLRELAEALHASGIHPFALMLSMRAGGRLPSGLFAAFPIRPAMEFVNALSVLVNETASELQRLALSAQLSHDARHDALTGLVSRAALEERLEQAVARQSNTRDIGLAVLYIDLDGFKNINDTLGHASGDDVLKAVAVRLSGCLRFSDVVGRVGGDEFTAVLEPVVDEAEAHSVGERMVRALSQPVAVPAGQVSCSASVGVAMWTPGLTADQLLAHADAAMYVAKEHKNEVSGYDPRLVSAAAERFSLRAALQQGLGQGEVEVFYQPVFGVTDLSLVSFEALARWRHPALGLLEPDSFIPLAEQSGLIVPLGRHVLLNAFRQLRDWQRQHPALAATTIAVNVSVRELEEPDYVDMVTAALVEAGLTPNQLVLEVTESLVMDEEHPGRARLFELYRLGVRIAIDDFGTGYSALSRLRFFPASQLKLDRIFVADIESDPFAADLAAAILALGRSLGLTTVAEGVETAGHLQWLRDHACEQAQGYFLSAPVPAADLEDILRAGCLVRSGTTSLLANE